MKGSSLSCLALLAAQVPPHAQDKEEGHEGQNEQNFHVSPVEPTTSRIEAANSE